MVVWDSFELLEFSCLPSVVVPSSPREDNGDCHVGYFHLRVGRNEQEQAGDWTAGGACLR